MAEHAIKRQKPQKKAVVKKAVKGLVNLFEVQWE